jgi:hypothetical protein
MMHRTVLVYEVCITTTGGFRGTNNAPKVPRAKQSKVELYRQANEAGPRSERKTQWY